MEVGRTTSAPEPRRLYRYQGSPQGYSRQRIEELAQPKQPRTVWIRTLGRGEEYDDGFDWRRIFWGDQESLWPLNKSTLNANATPRLTELSLPKPNFQGGKSNAEFLYSCGRQSVIWKVPDGAKAAEATTRVQELATPKTVHECFSEDRPHYVFSCGRSSPIWGVSDGAKRPATSDYMVHLSQAKSVHPLYQQPRGVETIIPRNALRATATPRVESLAEAKNRLEGPYRDPIWPVPSSALLSTGSKRLNQLSQPKPLAEGYQPSRPSDWRVSRSARNARPSERLDALSQAVVRASMGHVQFNPNAFLVSPAALKARCSPRVESLAQPLVRS